MSFTCKGKFNLTYMLNKHLHLWKERECSMFKAIEDGIVRLNDRHIRLKTPKAPKDEFAYAYVYNGTPVIHPF